MHIEVSWTGFWWLVELVGILAVIVMWRDPFRMRPPGGDGEEKRQGTAPAGNRGEGIRE